MASGEDVPTQVKACLTYQHLLEVPTVNRIWLLQGGQSILARFSQNDLVTESTRTFLRQWNNHSSGYHDTKFRTELTKVHVYAPHPKKDLVAIIRMKDETPGQETYFIESMEEHLTPKTDHFGELCWSEDGETIAYTAELNKPKSHSFWSTEKDVQPEARGNQYTLEEDWYEERVGEGYKGKSRPRLFLLNIKSGTIEEAKNIPEKLSLGQMSWANTNNERLLFVGWADATRKHGVRYCFNRRSSIYEYDIRSQSTTLLSGSDAIARTPRYTPDDREVVYVSSEELNLHGSCVTLKKVTLSDRKITTLVGVVDRPDSPGGFPGIYPTSVGLNARCFIDESHVALVVDIRKENSIPEVIRGPNDCAFTPTDCLTNGTIISITSSINVLPHITLTKASTTSQKLHVEHSNVWSIQGGINETVDKLEEVNSGTKTLGNFPESWEYTWLLPPPSTISEKIPVLLFAHGGPHSAVAKEYSVSFSFWALLGYAVVSVNYRGSLGYGQKTLESLPGNCGQQDVRDCTDSLDDFLLNFPQTDGERQFYNGGSHGGLIGGFLVGTTTRFRAVTLRNPVTHVASLYCTTDIPEWSLVEAGATHHSQVQKMYDISPFRHVDQTPTLFILGDSDRRVPPSQGLSMYYALKERGVDTHVKMYPKAGHAIVAAEQDADQAVNAVLWYNRGSNMMVSPSSGGKGNHLRVQSKTKIAAVYQILSGQRDMQSGRFLAAKEKIESVIDVIADIGNNQSVTPYRLRYLSDDEERCNSQWQLGEAYYHLGDYAKAVHHLNRSLKDFHDPKTEKYHRREILVKIHSTLADIYQRQGKYKRSSRKYRDAMEVFRLLSDKNGEATCLFHMGWNHYNEEAIQKSLDFFNESLVLRTDMQDGFGCGICLMYIANCQLKLGTDFSLVLDLFERSARLLEKSRDVHALAVCLNEVATANYIMGDMESSIEFYMRSSSIFETIGHQRGMAQSFGGLAVAECAKGRLDQGIIYGRLSLDLYRKTNDSAQVSKMLERLGSFYFSKNDSTNTILCYEKSVDVAKENGILDTLATAGVGLCKAYMEAGRFDEASKALRKSLRIFKFKNQSIPMQECSALMEQIARKQGSPSRVIGRERSISSMSAKAAPQSMLTEQANGDTFNRQRTHSTSGGMPSNVTSMITDRVEHSFVPHAFVTPQSCHQCHNNIWGIHQCGNCGFAVHKMCLFNVKKPCTLPCEFSLWTKAKWTPSLIRDGEGERNNNSLIFTSDGIFGSLSSDVWEVVAETLFEKQGQGGEGFIHFTSLGQTHQLHLRVAALPDRTNAVALFIQANKTDLPLYRVDSLGFEEQQWLSMVQGAANPVAKLIKWDGADEVECIRSTSNERDKDMNEIWPYMINKWRTRIDIIDLKPGDKQLVRDNIQTRDGKEVYVSSHVLYVGLDAKKFFHMVISFDQVVTRGRFAPSTGKRTPKKSQEISRKRVKMQDSASSLNMLPRGSLPEVTLEEIGILTVPDSKRSSFDISDFN
ncbi:acylamino-acid-releasing enzyme [Planoprotostelium fungivorum]|uniref:Acylamino-acid-releasing enzyme n=1 Tax=Planoprotostelium fungivorum TaxID=1890364 RepID=A0A2P6NMT7_9EUKA|nr:acylamino-acid-releasing enzyme [Planoprotostelium fungivorum]